MMLDKFILEIIGSIACLLIQLLLTMTIASGGICGVLDLETSVLTKIKAPRW